MRKCVRCGRILKNSSTLCYLCNHDWQKYMKSHPLTDDINVAENKNRWDSNVAENEKRWKEFIVFNPSRR